MSCRKRVRGRDLAKEALWRSRVASQRESGVSVRAYCQKERVGEAAFQWWRRELALRDREVPARDGAGGGGGLRATARGAFVEVSCLASAGSGSTEASPVEVVLRDGRVLRVREGFSPEMVSRLVALLEASPC